MLRDEEVKISYFGNEVFDGGVYDQIKLASRLPVAIKSAVMPDAHSGYSLPIGGVIALEKAVSPSFVGYDIGCSAMLSVYDMSVSDFEKYRLDIIDGLVKSTRFGVGAHFETPHEHAVMCDSTWESTKILKSLKGLALSQLGTSGAGNHFADIVLVKGVEGEQYIGLLTHGGSRGTGHKIATHYVGLADEQTKAKYGNRIPNGYGWLDLYSHEGEEYWDAMMLMGAYSKANHEIIHTMFKHYIPAMTIKSVFTRHNFAWNTPDGIIHRKGAVPTDQGEALVLASMASDSYLVTGIKNEDGLNSCSHGAGRISSRSKAKKDFDLEDYQDTVASRKITTINVPTDQTYQAYKNIETVMEAQEGVLVNTIASLTPLVVVMGGNERDD